MKTNTFLLLFLFTKLFSQAQDYQIRFTGTGASATVGSITVENLTQGKSLTLSGEEVLHLAKTITGLDPILNQNKTLLIYPNPAKENCTLEFVATSSGRTNIELFDISGKRIVTVQASLPIGRHSFQVSSLQNGIYTVRISSHAYTYTRKLISNGAPNSRVKISYIGNIETPFATRMLKSANAEKVMQYNTGDRLKITGNTGIYSTVITDVPIQSKTITFTFIACTDADGNNYPVVQIGTQVWMAENLKTTKYNDGTSIPLVLPGYTDYNETIPGYRWYNNDAATNKSTYGALYNWYAVNTGKLCFSGWHIPTNAEWTTLINFLGGEGVAGGKLKETGTTHWKSPNIGATNSSGFSALPGGERFYDDSFFFIGDKGIWWSSTMWSPIYAEFMYINSDESGVHNSNIEENVLMCFSVRCIKD